MAALVAAIHDLRCAKQKDVDAWNKSGHDVFEMAACDFGNGWSDATLRVPTHEAERKMARSSRAMRF